MDNRTKKKEWRRGKVWTRKERQFEEYMKFDTRAVKEMMLIRGLFNDIEYTAEIA